MSSNSLTAGLAAVVALAALAVHDAAAQTSSGTVRLANLDAAGGLADGSAGVVALSPAAEALRAALRSARKDDLTRFYETRAFQPIWFGPDGGEKALGLLAAIGRAGDHTLPASAYGVEALRDALDRARAAPAGQRLRLEAEAEIALSAALARYGADLAAGVLTPNRVDREIHVYPERPSAAALLSGAARATDMSAHVEGLAPSAPDYAALKSLLAEHRAAARSGGIPEGRLGGGSLRLGDRGPRVAMLRERLIELGDLPQASTPDPELFDVRLEAAVRAFQRRHGLNDDGVTGARTYAAMNAGTRTRLGQIAVNMERLRWMNRDLGRRHIVVNQADFRMALVEDGRVIHSSRVVVGKSSKFRTPEFSDEMTHMVVNPSWNVPRSIATKEILPKLREDPTYLARNNMQLIPHAGAGAQDPAPLDFSAYTARNFPYRIKQSPGASNSLGRVKFMFPNEFNIYLHDTPSKNLFRKDARAFSHGCVRVEDPFELAYLLLAPQESDPQGRFSRWLDTGREIYVNLDQPVPVHLTYRTVWVEADGTRQFRDDIYGRDARVRAALIAAGVEDI